MVAYVVRVTAYTFLTPATVIWILPIEVGLRVTLQCCTPACMSLAGDLTLLPASRWMCVFNRLFTVLRLLVFGSQQSIRSALLSASVAMLIEYNRMEDD